MPDFDFQDFYFDFIPWRFWKVVSNHFQSVVRLPNDTGYNGSTKTDHINRIPPPPPPGKRQHPSVDLPADEHYIFQVVNTITKDQIPMLSSKSSSDFGSNPYHVACG